MHLVRCSAIVRTLHTVLMVLSVWLIPSCGSESAPLEPEGAVSEPSTVASSSEAMANRPLPPESEPAVRIRVQSLKVPFAPLQLGSASQRLLVVDGLELRPRILQGPILCSLDPKAGWLLEDGTGRLVETPEPCLISLRTLAGEVPRIHFEDLICSGVLQLIPIERPAVSEDPPDSTILERVDLVARIPIESYLPGVLDGELYGHWPQATFRAQAVAARSYAVAESAYWGDRRHYDLVAGPASQAWTGMEASSAALEAVESTRGMLLVHEGRVVPAYYSSCCGGLPASAIEGISNRSSHEIAPLQARSSPVSCCAEAPVHSWEVRFPLSRVRAILAPLLASSGLGPVATVAVSKRTDLGRPLEFEVGDEAGRTHQFSARFFRTLLGRVIATGAQAPASLKSEALEPEVQGDELVVQGRGFGHGVGLCQFGAFERGRAGDPWEQITLRYYPRAELVRGWN